MEKVSHLFKILGFFCSPLLLLGGCLVAQSDTPACKKAFNKRDYTTAIAKCTKRSDLAASYLGNAGFDIVSAIGNDEEEPKAITDEIFVALLGEQQVNGASILRLLKLSPTKIPNESTREAAIKASKLSLEEAITLLTDVSADDMSTDEKFLEIFSTVFALQLEMLLLIDVGQATSLDPSNSSAISSTLTTGIAAGTINSSSISTFHLITKEADGDTLADDILVRLDGKIWEKEQNLSILPDAFPLTGATAILLGSTIDLGGNLTNICASLSSSGATSTTTDPPGRGIVTLSTLLLNALGKLADGQLSDNDFVNSISESQAELATQQALIAAQCEAFL